MKQAPKPFNQEEAGESPGMPDPDDASGFQNFQHNAQFLHKLHNQDFPHKGAGTHVPVWLSPALAKAVLASHGRTGHAMPHPNINLKDITK